MFGKNYLVLNPILLWAISVSLQGTYSKMFIGRCISTRSFTSVTCCRLTPTPHFIHAYTFTLIFTNINICIFLSWALANNKALCMSLRKQISEPVRWWHRIRLSWWRTCGHAYIHMYMSTCECNKRSAYSLKASIQKEHAKGVCRSSKLCES